MTTEPPPDFPDEDLPETIEIETVLRGDAWIEKEEKDYGKLEISGKPEKTERAD